MDSFEYGWEITVTTDKRIREFLMQALEPYRVLTGEPNPYHRGEDEQPAQYYSHLIKRTEATAKLNENRLAELYAALSNLRDALQVDADKWAREAEDAPEDASGLCLKPRLAFTTLAEVRERQVQKCEYAIEFLLEAGGFIHQCSIKTPRGVLDVT